MNNPVRWAPLALSLTLFCLSTSAAYAAPEQQEHPSDFLMFYLLYAILSGCVLGWSFLVILMAKTRVEHAAHSLAQRPLACFVMGMMCCGWLLLSLSLPQILGPLGGLLAVATMCALALCTLIGLPAILLGLGRRASVVLGHGAASMRDIALGAAVLFAAGGLPFLGWLLLIGAAIWACGGAVLGLLTGNGAAPTAPADDISSR